MTFSHSREDDLNVIQLSDLAIDLLFDFNRDNLRVTVYHGMSCLPFSVPTLVCVHIDKNNSMRFNSIDSSHCKMHPRISATATSQRHLTVYWDVLMSMAQSNEIDARTTSYFVRNGNTNDCVLQFRYVQKWLAVHQRATWVNSELKLFFLIWFGKPMAAVVDPHPLTYPRHCGNSDSVMTSRRTHSFDRIMPSRYW